MGSEGWESEWRIMRREEGELKVEGVRVRREDERRKCIESEVE